MRLVLKSRKWKTATGKEELLGSEGIVTSALSAHSEGMVRVHGELWRATSKEDLPAGARVRVRHVEGLKVDVEPVGAAGLGGK